MNNSRLIMDGLPQKATNTELMQEREAKLVRIVDAIKQVVESKAWSSLKTEVFDGQVEELKRSLFAEARKDHPDVQALAKLNGKYEIAKRYHDLLEFAKVYQTELTNLRIKLHGASE